MAELTLQIGLREANVAKLRWSQVDLNRKMITIDAEEMKSGITIGIPLNATVIKLIKKQQGLHSVYVFCYQGRPVKKASTRSFRKALKRSGIADFRWHDLRHTWASWHVMNGTPLHVLQELGGWASYDMVLRYAHLSAEHLRQYIKNTEK